MAELCAGYSSQCLALEQLRQDGHPEFQYDCVFWSEFDPESRKPLAEQPAVVAHNALFPEFAARNVGDMTKPDFSAIADDRSEPLDLLVYSTPCTDISQAGKREGIARGSGTRSAILWQTEEFVRQWQPRFLLQENVAALVNQENKPHFDEWRAVLSRLGYQSDWRVLNARDYGVPQNRERVFMVSWRRDMGLPPAFPWPQPVPLERCIADVLEPEVSDAFFLKPASVQAFLEKNEQQGEQYVYRTTERKLTNLEVEKIIMEIKG